ncbi:hypothetical protein [Nodularia sp. NIES-3585]|uniref:hypothetical protein n=1 Tax=Nodularia sp. NIES-3585 TaxID=1973477 RepID=UPI000B65A78A|nr:hypothetical protein [Nodularia sp. NIES-3585]GAX36788.1 hypothetical protein NIES3585_28250 [Nodularia sp. NIES-3585]
MKKAQIQITDLHFENCTELTGEDLLLIQGGWVWIPIAIYVAANWPEIKKGVSDGWNH